GRCGLPAYVAGEQGLLAGLRGRHIPELPRLRARLLLRKVGSLPLQPDPQRPRYEPPAGRVLRPRRSGRGRLRKPRSSGGANHDPQPLTGSFGGRPPPRKVGSVGLPVGVYRWPVAGPPVSLKGAP